MNTENKTYLGDSVYATNDGYHILIHADFGTIYLHAAVLQELINYALSIGFKLSIPKEGEL